jgi:hypothetical protein
MLKDIISKKMSVAEQARYWLEDCCAELQDVCTEAYLEVAARPGGVTFGIAPVACRDWYWTPSSYLHSFFDDKCGVDRYLFSSKDLRADAFLSRRKKKTQGDEGRIKNKLRRLAKSARRHLDENDGVHRAPLKEIHTACMIQDIRSKKKWVAQKAKYWLEDCCEELQDVSTEAYVEIAPRSMVAPDPCDYISSCPGKAPKRRRRTSEKKQIHWRKQGSYHRTPCEASAIAAESFEKTETDSQEKPMLQVLTMSGQVYSRALRIFDVMRVRDIKLSLESRVNLIADRQTLLYQGDILDDAKYLTEVIPESDWRAAESGASVIQLTLVKLALPTIVVPDDCSSISEAVAQLSTRGGLVEVIAPPLVEQDIIEILRSDISIIATGPRGVDTRRAKIYVKTPRKQCLKQNVLIHGLQNLAHVSIVECSHGGSIVFRDCNLLPYREMHVQFHPYFKSPYEAFFSRYYKTSSSCMIPNLAVYQYCEENIASYCRTYPQSGVVFNAAYGRHWSGSAYGRPWKSLCATVYTSTRDVHRGELPETKIEWPSNCAPRMNRLVRTHEAEILPGGPWPSRQVPGLTRSYAAVCRSF